jgi:hypothetical protein
MVELVIPVVVSVIVVLAVFVKHQANRERRNEDQYFRYHR